MAIGTFSAVQTWTIIACPRESCGITFAINDEYRDRRVDDHKGFYCPNGHSMSYGEDNEAEKQRKRADRLARIVEAREEDIRTEQRRLESERRRHAATKGQLTKTRRRAEHAMCPVDGCKRSFANVARHIASQHPGFKAKS